MKSIRLSSISYAFAICTAFSTFLGCGEKPPVRVAKAWLPIVYGSQVTGGAEGNIQQDARVKAGDRMVAQTEIQPNFALSEVIPQRPEDVFTSFAGCDSFVPAELEGLSKATCGVDKMLYHYQKHYRGRLRSTLASSVLVLYVTPVYVITANPGLITGQSLWQDTSVEWRDSREEVSFLFDNATNEVLQGVDPDFRNATKATYIGDDILHEL